jgi:hypothetical protein
LEHAVNENHTQDPQPGILARLQALTHLTIASNGRELGNVKSLLPGLPPMKCLDSLTLEIKKARHFEEGALWCELRGSGAYATGGRGGRPR